MKISEIKPGDIIVILERKYIDFQSDNWQLHFGKPQKCFYLVKNNPSNNGSFKAVNSKNQMRNFYVDMVSEIIKRRQERN